MKFIHFRNADEYVKTGRGTSWTVAFTYEDGKILVGFTRCSKDDMFCRKTGRELAVQSICDRASARYLEFPINLRPCTEKAEQHIENIYYPAIRDVFLDTVIKANKNKRLSIVKSNMNRGIWYSKRQNKSMENPHV